MSLQIPIVDVTVDTMKVLHRTMEAALRRCDFVAVDTELSGLSNSRTSMAKEMDERYKALRDTAAQYSVIQIGLSFFIPKSQQQQESSPSRTKSMKSYDIRTYQIFTLCQENFMLSPTSLAFLSRHNFDFNSLPHVGIPYWPVEKHVEPELRLPQSPLPEKSMEAGKLLREFIEAVLTSNKPIIVHNGLLDLMFLCHNFHKPLPDKFSKFVTYVVETIPILYDTKYLAEYVQQENATFLQYLLRKCWSRVAKMRASEEIMERHNYFGGLVKEEEYLSILREISDHPQQICARFLQSGFCPRELICELSHDVNDIIWKEDIFTPAKKRKVTESEQPTQSEKAVCEESKPKAKSTQSISNGSHSAGFDAYATGYVFAYYTFLLEDTMKEHENKLFLMGKKLPLWLQKSQFSQ